MESLSLHEHERGEPKNILQACEQAFLAAYELHSASGAEDYVQVPEGSNAELIRLSKHTEPYDVILFRPHLDAQAGNIAFWLDRIITSKNPRDYREYEHLVALAHEPSQLYVQQKEDDKPSPYGRGATKDIINYIENAQVMPL